VIPEEGYQGYPPQIREGALYVLEIWKNCAVIVAKTQRHWSG